MAADFALASIKESEEPIHGPRYDADIKRYRDFASGKLRHDAAHRAKQDTLRAAIKCQPRLRFYQIKGHYARLR